jgi:hypothetical protein
MQLRPSLFRDVTRLMSVLVYWRLTTSYRFNIWTAWASKTGRIGCPETSVNYYQHNVLIVKRTQHLRTCTLFSSTTCFGRVYRPSSGRNYNTMKWKTCCSGGFPFKVPKYAWKHVIRARASKLDLVVDIEGKSWDGWGMTLEQSEDG